jgi:hypothetical protein
MKYFHFLCAARGIVYFIRKSNVYQGNKFPVSMQTIKTKSIATINIRISLALRESLDLYCETHIVKLSEAVVSAIKAYIGFGQPPCVKKEKAATDDKPKTLRLDIRVDSRIKDALEVYCRESGETVSEAVVEAIERFTKL